MTCAPDIRLNWAANNATPPVPWINTVLPGLIFPFFYDRVPGGKRGTGQGSSFGWGEVAGDFDYLVFVKHDILLQYTVSGWAAQGITRLFGSDCPFFSNSER